MLHTAQLVLAALTLLVVLVAGVDLIVGGRSIPRLAQETRLVGPEPLVSVIVAARNEESAIAQALLSILGQSYRNYEVIVVNDRSTDRTGEILTEIAAKDSRLRVITVSELPRGWIGKNHALCMGAESASGELLLFTDADILYSPETLSRAMGYFERQGVDHLTAVPDLVLRTAPLALVVNFFTLSFQLFTRPWKASDPKSDRSLGIGAFNLVRRASYERAGTHRMIAMRPDDDLRLGRILKQSGAMQHVVSGHGLISVAWYDSLGAMVHGMRKNGFAAFDYRLSALIAASVAALLLNVWPFVAVWISTGAARLLYAAICVLLVAAYAANAALARSRPWLAPLYPIAALIFLYILWQSVWFALVNGGISWRDTHYSLSELRAGSKLRAQLTDSLP